MLFFHRPHFKKFTPFYARFYSLTENSLSMECRLILPSLLSSMFLWLFFLCFFKSILLFLHATWACVHLESRRELEVEEMLAVHISIQGHNVSPGFSQLYGEGWLMGDIHVCSVAWALPVPILSSRPVHMNASLRLRWFLFFSLFFCLSPLQQERFPMYHEHFLWADRSETNLIPAPHFPWAFLTS